LTLPRIDNPSAIFHYTAAPQLLQRLSQSNSDFLYNIITTGGYGYGAHPVLPTSALCHNPSSSGFNYWPPLWGTLGRQQCKVETIGPLGAGGTRLNCLDHMHLMPRHVTTFMMNPHYYNPNALILQLQTLIVCLQERCMLVTVSSYSRCQSCPTSLAAHSRVTCDV